MNTVKLKFSLLLEILEAFKFHSLTKDNIFILSMLFLCVFIKQQLGIKAV